MTDMAQKLRRYGSLSVRQLNFFRKLIDQVKDGEDRESRRKSSEERYQATNPQDVAKGRYEMTGRVLSVKMVESPQWGPTEKMLVLTDNGFKVWGTTPRINDEDGRFISLSRGDRVRFTARVEPSDDAKFGFFSRPSKASKYEIEVDRSFETHLDSPSSWLAYADWLEERGDDVRAAEARGEWRWGVCS